MGSLTPLQFGLSIVEVLASLFLIVTILLQKGKAQGIGAVDGGADTFFGAQKARGIDAILNKLTTFIAVLAMVLAVVLNLVQ